jgi:predicted dehydrogenase/nucleoside-diphosphate-sugar epimerase
LHCHRSKWFGAQVEPHGCKSVSLRFMSNIAGGDLRIALVGCGAIAHHHAQAMVAEPEARCVALFDVNRERAVGFRDAYFPQARILTNLDDVSQFANAAIVAVPNRFHAPVALTLLRAGLDILCEKPLATTLADAQEMAAVASGVNCVLHCGLMRRFFGSTQLVIEALQRQIVGQPRSFEVRESVWNWPLGRASFEQEIAGGGVLIDLGPHVFDQLALWFGPLEVLEYRDDCRGGVEAVAYAKVRCRTKDGNIEGDIFLTRAYKLQSHARVVCEDGLLEVEGRAPDQLKISFGHGPQSFTTTAQKTVTNPFAKQLRCFISAVQGKDEIAAVDNAGLETVSLIESCYDNRQPISEPWAEPNVPASVGEPDYPYKKILITGATGMVGSRLVEMWAASNRLSELRCMVRSYRTAARIMRFPVEVVEADLGDGDAVRRAVKDCDAIVHLGVGDRAERETLALLKAARANQVRRFVHMSSAAVYGLRIPRSVEQRQEDSKVIRTGQPYPEAKAAAEALVLRECSHGLEAVILRPHIVYGPYMSFSADLMASLAQDRLCVISDGGWCNLIYVDDLVRAVRSALITKEGIGRPMFITDGAPLTWRAYIEAHAALISVEPRSGPRSQLDQARSGAREWLRASVRPLAPILKSEEFRSFVFESPAVQATMFRAYLALRDKKIFQPYVTRMRRSSSNAGSIEQNGSTFDAAWTNIQLSEARLSAERAGTILGFRAQIDFAEGLRRSARWFKRYDLMTNR